VHPFFATLTKLQQKRYCDAAWRKLDVSHLKVDRGGPAVKREAEGTLSVARGDERRVRRADHDPLYADRRNFCKV
jgi:hypothetical protein